MVAVEDSVIYQFERRDLLKIFKNDFLVKNLFDSIVGKDITKKLFSLHQKMLMEKNATISEQSRHTSLLVYSGGKSVEISLCVITKEQHQC